MDAEELRLQDMAGHMSDLHDEFALMEAEVSEAARVASEAAGQVRTLTGTGCARKASPYLPNEYI